MYRTAICEKRADSFAATVGANTYCYVYEDGPDMADVDRCNEIGLMIDEGEMSVVRAFYDPDEIVNAAIDALVSYRASYSSEGATYTTRRCKMIADILLDLLNDEEVESVEKHFWGTD